jgi:hypothetical protein
MKPSRSTRRKRLYAHAVLASVMLSAVLVARSTPPSFPLAPSSSSSIQAVTHHDQRPRFEHNRAQWSTPENSFLLPPPTLESRPVATTLQLVFTFRTMGLHYNRPPPLGPKASLSHLDSGFAGMNSSGVSDSENTLANPLPTHC